MTGVDTMLDTYAKLVEARLPEFLRTSEHLHPRLYEAMHYSLMAGGKRIRPALLLAACESVGGDVEDAMPAACAVEMIHTYSLIHDDLPAMDNDDWRRGKATNHKVFGEAMAILAGDGLLTQAFYALTFLPVDARRVVQLIRELAVFAGPGGMVGGQAGDILAENQPVSIESLSEIHRHKTADLFVFCLRSGAIIGGATDGQLSALTDYAYHLGMAFQIQDDILDIIGDKDKLGKSTGSDANKNKATYPAIAGMAAAQEALNMHMNKALQALALSNAKTEKLAAFARYMVKRRH
jgi:geranylgeranyl diphosphate synthase type II